MKVRDLMTRDVETCRADSALASVAEILYRRDCGVVPVVDADRRVVGVVTDRDVAIALGTSYRLASDVKASEAMSKRVHACKADDDVIKALGTMRTEKVRRLPVADRNGVLEGLLSLDDVVRCAAAEGAGEEPTDAQVLAVMKSLCEQRVPLPSPAIARR